MNMLYESIVKRGSLMVVPSGLADSLNHPSLMGLLGASGLVPKEPPANGATDRVPATAPGGSRPARREEG
jgi:hypothetical protein